MTREETIRKIWREEYMSEPKMTLEYIIYKLDDAVVIGDDETVGRMIKQVWPQLGAALRRLDRLEKAGQALRDWPYTPNKSWNEVSKAWDAATAKGKGE